jgi:hypothetical protein
MVLAQGHLNWWRGHRSGAQDRYAPTLNTVTTRGPAEQECGSACRGCVTGRTGGGPPLPERAAVLHFLGHLGEAVSATAG